MSAGPRESLLAESAKGLELGGGEGKEALQHVPSTSSSKLRQQDSQKRKQTSSDSEALLSENGSLLADGAKKRKNSLLQQLLSEASDSPFSDDGSDIDSPLAEVLQSEIGSPLGDGAKKRKPPLSDDENLGKKLCTTFTYHDI